MALMAEGLEIIRTTTPILTDDNGAQYVDLPIEVWNLLWDLVEDMEEDLLEWIESY